MNVWRMDAAMAREERYDQLCSFIAEHGRSDTLDFLNAFDADTDLIHEAEQRWSREHVRNAVGRVEGTVTREGDGRWLASAECGINCGQSRAFLTEKEAAYWVRTGQFVPEEHLERVRASAGPGGADPSFAHLDEEAAGVPVVVHEGRQP